MSEHLDEMAASNRGPSIDGTVNDKVKTRRTNNLVKSMVNCAVVGRLYNVKNGELLDYSVQWSRKNFVL